MPKYKIAPLKSSFMLASILIFFIAVYWIPTISVKWAWAIGFLAVIMFSSALISQTYAPLPEEIRVKDEQTVEVKNVIKLEKKKVIKKKVVKNPVKKVVKKAAAKKKVMNKAVKKKIAKKAAKKKPAKK